MRRIIGIAATVVAMSVGAQNPPAPPAPGVPGGARTAQSLLARSAQLDLTDQQVVRLAAIARRGELRQRALRAQVDSGRARFTQPGDSAARRQFAERMRTNAEREREQGRVDLRDAIAVLTPDQQARAWEMNARRGGPRRVGAPGMGRGARGMGARGPGRPRDGARPGVRGRPDGMGPAGMGARGRPEPDMPRRTMPRRPLEEPPTA